MIPIYIQRFFYLIFLFTIAIFTAVGQNNPYRAEIGIQVGGNVYSGDVNTVASPDLYIRNLKNIKPDVGVVFRYRFNKRLALRLGYDFTKVKGNYLFRDTLQTHAAYLNNPLHLIDLTGEFNFVDLENNPYKRTSKKVSPYIFAGIGWVMMPKYNNNTTGVNQAMTLPFGVGIKTKLGNRWNFNIQWTNRLLLKDNLEGVSLYDNPTPMTIHNPLNHDFLSGIAIGLTYDFWANDCDCNQNTFQRSNKPKQQKAVKQKNKKNKKSRRK